MMQGEDLGFKSYKAQIPPKWQHFAEAGSGAKCKWTRSKLAIAKAEDDSPSTIVHTRALEGNDDVTTDISNLSTKQQRHFRAPDSTFNPNSRISQLIRGKDRTLRDHKDIHYARFLFGPEKEVPLDELEESSSSGFDSDDDGDHRRREGGVRLRQNNKSSKKSSRGSQRDLLGGRRSTTRGSSGDPSSVYAADDSNPAAFQFGSTLVDGSGEDGLSRRKKKTWTEEMKAYIAKSKIKHEAKERTKALEHVLRQRQREAAERREREVEKFAGNLVFVSKASDQSVGTANQSVSNDGTQKNNNNNNNNNNTNNQISNGDSSATTIKKEMAVSDLTTTSSANADRTLVAPNVVVGSRSFQSMRLKNEKGAEWFNSIVCTAQAVESEATRERMNDVYEAKQTQKDTAAREHFQKVVKQSKMAENVKRFKAKKLGAGLAQKMVSTNLAAQRLRMEHQNKLLKAQQESIARQRSHNERMAQLEEERSIHAREKKQIELDKFNACLIAREEQENASEEALRIRQQAAQARLENMKSYSGYSHNSNSTTISINNRNINRSKGSGLASGAATYSSVGKDIGSDGSLEGSEGIAGVGVERPHAPAQRFKEKREKYDEDEHAARLQRVEALEAERLRKISQKQARAEQNTAAIKREKRDRNAKHIANETARHQAAQRRLIQLHAERAQMSERTIEKFDNIRSFGRGRSPSQERSDDQNDNNSDRSKNNRASSLSPIRGRSPCNASISFTTSGGVNNVSKRSLLGENNADANNIVDDGSVLVTAFNKDTASAVAARLAEHQQRSLELADDLECFIVEQSEELFAKDEAFRARKAQEEAERQAKAAKREEERIAKRTAAEERRMTLENKMEAKSSEKDAGLTKRLFLKEKIEKAQRQSAAAKNHERTLASLHKVNVENQRQLLQSLIEKDKRHAERKAASDEVIAKEKEAKTTQRLTRVEFLKKQVEEAARVRDEHFESLAMTKRERAEMAEISRVEQQEEQRQRLAEKAKFAEAKRLAQEVSDRASFVAKTTQLEERLKSDKTYHDRQQKLLQQKWAGKNRETEETARRYFDERYKAIQAKNEKTVNSFINRSQTPPLGGSLAPLPMIPPPRAASSMQ